MDGERLRRVMRPKVDAAIHLHELTRELPLSEFIPLFSSAAACLGSPGQGNYAAANAFLDALAAARQAEGLPALSLAFGFWERVTELTQHLTTADGRRAGPLGLLPMSDELGLDLVDTARTAGKPMLAPMRLDLAKLAARARAGHTCRWSSATSCESVRGAWQRSPPAAGRQARAMGAGWGRGRSAPRSPRPSATQSPAALDLHLTFLELGFDSLVSLELRNPCKRSRACAVGDGDVRPSHARGADRAPAEALGTAPPAGPVSDAPGRRRQRERRRRVPTDAGGMFRRACQLASSGTVSRSPRRLRGCVRGSGLATARAKPRR